MKYFKVKCCLHCGISKEEFEMFKFPCAIMIDEGKLKEYEQHKYKEYKLPYGNIKHE